MAIEFVANGSPRVLARAIEELARTQGSVTALVVPWESDATTLQMAVTAVKTDGWAIEHRNLGTIRLTDAGAERTRISMVADPRAGDPEPRELTLLFERFARHLQGRLDIQAATPARGESPTA